MTTTSDRHATDAEADRVRDIELGLADIAAGRSLDHETVAAWLKTWGTDREGPPPTCDGLTARRAPPAARPVDRS